METSIESKKGSEEIFGRQVWDLEKLKRYHPGWLGARESCISPAG